MRFALAALLAFFTACTLLDSESGLVGPPLEGDAGAAVDGVTTGGSTPPGTLDASAPASSDDASPDASADASTTADAAALADAGADASAPAADAGPTAIYTQLLSPLGIAVYAGTLCWCAGDTLRMIQCAPSTGGSASSLTTVATQSNDALVAQAFDVALDDTYFYWSNGPNNQLMRQARSGGASAQYFTGDGRLSYIVLDGTNLWASDYVAGATGGSVVVGPSGSSSQLIFGGETQAAGVAVYSGSVYWGRATPGSVSFGLTAGNTPITRVPTAGSVTGLAIDAAGTAYFISGDSQIYRLAQGASTPVLLYDAGSSFGDSDLALDDGAVYWSEHDLGLIMRLPR